MKKYFAEMIGTMVLVLMGYGAAAISCAPGVLTTGILAALVWKAFECKCCCKKENADA